MMKNKNKTKRLSDIIMLLSGPVFVAAITFVFIMSLSNVGRTSDKQGLNILQQSLNRAVISCYATEGVYPPSLDYIEQHYGIKIDDEKYAVYYNAFADNIMPDITVVSLSEH